MEQSMVSEEGLQARIAKKRKACDPGSSATSAGSADSIEPQSSGSINLNALNDSSSVDVDDDEMNDDEDDGDDHDDEYDFDDNDVYPSDDDYLNMACDPGSSATSAGSADSIEPQSSGSKNLNALNDSSSVDVDDDEMNDDEDDCDDHDDEYDLDDNDVYPSDDDYLNMACDPGSSATLAGSVDGIEPQSSGSKNLNALNDSSSVDVDDDEMNDDDDYLNMESQFENLPPGVEASVHWLKDPSPSENTLSTKKLTISHLPPAATSAACSSAGPSESSSSKDIQDSDGNGLMQKFEQFKQFDVAEDFSDHHYSRMGFSDEQPPKNWAKRIQDEWKILEKALPDTIFVRVYEARMELLRAVIIGPPGTPYHDGLFVFDCLFPTDYPNSPPSVYYYSSGLRLNPNLYDCGKVCLSLLGTWTGEQRENWIPGESTMLQVLVSIQALILNADPFFNEPGYEKRFAGAEGQKQSKKYNEDAFIMSLKTMMYTLKKPPKYFEDFVSGHFRNRAHNILAACKAYSEGAVVGSAIGDAAQNGVQSSSRVFRSSVARMMSMLVIKFTRNGTDCEEFRGAA